MAKKKNKQTKQMGEYIVVKDEEECLVVFLKTAYQEQSIHQIWIAILSEVCPINIVLNYISFDYILFDKIHLCLCKLKSSLYIFQLHVSTPMHS